MASIGTSDDRALRAKLAAKGMKPPAAQPGGYGNGYAMPASAAPVENPGYGTGYAGYTPKAPPAAPATSMPAAGAKPSGASPFSSFGITDWGAPFRGGSAGGGGAAGDFGAAPAGPAQGPPELRAALTARRQQEQVRDKGDVFDMQYYQSQLNHPGAFPADKATGASSVDTGYAAQQLGELRDRRHFRSKELGALGDALAPTQTPQSPDQIAASRNDISAKLGQTLLQRRLAQAKAQGQNPDRDALVASSMDDANKALPILNPNDPRVAKIGQGQQALQAKQAALRGLGGEQPGGEGTQAAEAVRQTGINTAGEQLGIEGRQTRAAIMRSQMGEAKATAEHGRLAAEYGNSAEAMDAERRARVANATTAAAIAEKSGAGAVAAAGGQSAKITRDAALQQAGVTDAEVQHHAQLMDAFGKEMSSFVTGGVSGGALGGAEGAARSAAEVRGFIGHLERIENPQTRQLLAQEMLAHMPLPDPKTGTYARWSLTGARTQTRELLVSHMNDIYARLKAMATSASPG